MKLAVIADIHGNLKALRAVLDDITSRHIDRIVNLGDCFYGPLDPGGTADLLAALTIPTVCGNEDRMLLQDQTGAASASSLAFTRSRLSDRHFNWVQSLPSTIVLEDLIFLCHGTPRSDTAYLLHDVSSWGVAVKNVRDLKSELRDIPQRLILCGHDHTQQRIRLPDGRLIVNPGSVGLPAYCDDSPWPHSMEAGSPHARYSIVSLGAGEWSVEEISVVYDWDKAASLALVNGRSDWARWLRMGRAG